MAKRRFAVSYGTQERCLVTSPTNYQPELYEKTQASRIILVLTIAISYMQKDTKRQKYESSRNFLVRTNTHKAEANNAKNCAHIVLCLTFARYTWALNAKKVSVYKLAGVMPLGHCCDWLKYMKYVIKASQKKHREESLGCFLQQSISANLQIHKLSNRSNNVNSTTKIIDDDTFL